MKRILSIVVIALCSVCATSASAGNSIMVTSTSVAAGEVGIEIPILLTNDVAVKTVVVPLVIRSVTNGAFITALAMSYGDRLPLNGALSEFVGHNQYQTEDGNCKSLNPGGFGTIAFADGASHPVAASPEGLMMTRFRIFGPNLEPGSDVTGSMILTVDINLHEGHFEIDTTCTNPNNHLFYVRTDNTGIVPDFTKGVITVGSPPANYPPIAHDDAFHTYETSTLNVPPPGVLENDTDAEGDPLTAQLVTPPTHGVVVLNSDGSFAYTAESGFTGTDQFTYRAYDGAEYSRSPAAVTIEVLPYGPSLPEAVDDSFSVVLGFALEIPAPGILANDTDPNGDALTAIRSEGPYYGTLTLNSDGSFRYVPTPVFTGVDHFTYFAFDGILESAQPATVRITVIPNVGGPVANNDLYTIPQTGVFSVPAPGVLINDADPFGLPLCAVLETDVQHGTLNLNCDGSFDYVASSLSSGFDSFRYRVFTGESISNPATVMLVWQIYGNSPPATVVHLDIKPGSCPNPLNIQSKGRGKGGVLPVAVLGGPDFDVNRIVVGTVRLEGCAPLRSSIDDVAGIVPVGDGECGCNTSGPEGYPDLTLKFDRDELIDAIGPVEAGDEIELLITGLLTDESEFYGTDCVRITGPMECAITTGNHPNPFNNATTITYSLAEPDHVRLQVFDLLGRRVATLVDEYRPAGTYEVVWDGHAQSGGDVASGVYFYRVQAGGESATRKIILLK